MLVDLHMRAPHRLFERLEISAYYVVAEALTNAAKHARAASATAMPDFSDLIPPSVGTRKT